ncbi:MAG: hypothetical protein R3Y47_02615 [Lachnospiraceae bacterium]
MKTSNKGNSIGISLILVVFILLCLITFGTLSFMLADADNDLSISSAENITQYYAADMLAQEELQRIDALLQELYTTSNDYVQSLEENFDDISVEDGDVYLTFSTQVSEQETLISTLLIYTEVETDYYRITSWTLENTANL